MVDCDMVPVVVELVISELAFHLCNHVITSTAILISHNYFSVFLIFVPDFIAGQ